MIYNIFKNCHRAFPPIFGLFVGNKIEKNVTFNWSAKYDIGEDQADINKLFGIGYFPSHHKESARVGWQYNIDTNKIAIYAYCYVNGKRVTEKLCEVAKNRPIKCMLDIYDGQYTFAIVDSLNPFRLFGKTVINYTHKKTVGYLLGVYFGGNKKAPHKIKIQMT